MSKMIKEKEYRLVLVMLLNYVLDAFDSARHPFPPQNPPIVTNGIIILPLVMEAQKVRL